MNRLLMFVIGMSACTAALAFDVPVFNADVIDESQTLNQEQILALNKQIAELRADADVYAALYIVNTTKPLSVEEAASKVFAEWKLGRKDSDNGLLILVALADRRARIEVGYGLEPEFTDADMLSVQHTAMTPAFKRGNYYAGLSAALELLRQLKLEGRTRLRLPQPRAEMPPLNVGHATTASVFAEGSWSRYFGFVGIGLAPIVVLFWPAYLYGRLKKRTDLMDRVLVKLGHAFCIFLSLLFGTCMALIPLEALGPMVPFFLLIYILFYWPTLFRYIPMFVSGKSYRRAKARVRWRKIYNRAYGERVIFGRRYVVRSPDESTSSSRGSGTSGGTSSHSSSSSRSSSSGGGSSGGGGASSSW